MSARAPIEVWSEILKHAIAVPLFFDPDPITNHGMEQLSQYRSEAAYWQSERTRNALRRICSSWNTFLSLYNHRYVLMGDVYHHQIPVRVITKAIRLNMRGCDNYICAICRPSNQIPGGPVTRPSDVSAELMEVEAPLKGWSIKIIDLYGPNTAFIPLLFERSLQLESVLGIVPTRWVAIEAIRTPVKFIHMESVHRAELPHALSLPHLTSLKVTSRGSGVVGSWNLPALRHLSIYTYGSFPPNVPSFSSHLSAIARNLGTNLITLHCPGIREDYIIPDEIWQYIPRVERIQMPFWGQKEPPVDHPVRVVRIGLHWSRRMLSIDRSSVSPNHGYFPQWTQSSAKSLVTVEMDESWLTCLTANSTTLALSLSSYYRDKGIEFTDMNGVSFDEYLLYILKAYWRDGKGRRIYRGRQITFEEYTF